jgi:hypothetical protein
MSHLPARPLRLRKGYALKLLATAGPVFALTVALGIGMVVYGAMQAQDQLAERALWKNGALSTNAVVEGEVLSLEKLKTQYGAELKKWRLTVKVCEETRAIGLLSNMVPEHPTFPLRDLHPFVASPEPLKALEAALPRA